MLGFCTLCTYKNAIVNHKIYNSSFFVYKKKAKIIYIINYGFHLQGFRTYYIIRGQIDKP